jgi:hypothetical protein
MGQVHTMGTVPDHEGSHPGPQTCLGTLLERAVFEGKAAETFPTMAPQPRFALPGRLVPMWHTPMVMNQKAKTLEMDTLSECVHHS